jgi:hypothetical protein
LGLGHSGSALVDAKGNAVGMILARQEPAPAAGGNEAPPAVADRAVKGTFMLGFLECVPEVSASLAEPHTREHKLEEAAKAAELSTALVVAY